MTLGPEDEGPEDEGPEDEGPEDEPQMTLGPEDDDADDSRSGRRATQMTLGPEDDGPEDDDADDSRSGRRPLGPEDDELLELADGNCLHCCDSVGARDLPRRRMMRTGPWVVQGDTQRGRIQAEAVVYSRLQNPGPGDTCENDTQVGDD